MRIDKLLSNMKYGTRKEVGKSIKKGYLKINGKVVKDNSFKVNPIEDNVVFHDEIVVYKENILLMLNKPKGYVSANYDALHPTVLDLIDEPYSRLDLKIAGRLDIDTEGLLLLTDSGEMIHNLISPKKDVYKKYFVRTKEPFDPTKLLWDFEILDGKNQPFKPLTPIVEKLTDNEFYLSIKEGKFHQVKRMVAHFNNEVTYLKRVSVGDIILDEELKLGEYKEIKKEL